MKVLIIYLLTTHLLQIRAIGLCCKQTGAKTFPSAKDVMLLDNLERIPCNSTSQESFHENFEKLKKPVILVGCDEDWPAKTKWTFKNLVERFDPDSKWRVVDIDNDLIEYLPDDRISWQYVVDAIESKKTFYVFDNLNTTQGKTLEDDYETPLFFQNDLYQHFNSSFPPDYGPMRWFALGSHFSGTTAHYDPYQTDAWNTVLYGMKWWILFPPNAHKMIGDDYEMLGCDSTCSDDSISLAEYYDTVWNAPNHQFNDFFIGQAVQHVIQKEGETLYVPNGMIHSVMNVEDTIAITANYANANNNIAAIWDELFDFDADNDEMIKIYCQILTQSQRDELDYDYYCDDDINSGSEL